MHADAAREVDERVAVDVGDRAARRLRGEHREVHDAAAARPRAARARGSRASVGPGISVRMSIDLVTDTARSVAERCGDTLAQVEPPTSTPTRSYSSRRGSAEARAAGIVHAEAMALATAIAGRGPIRADGARSRVATARGSRSSRTSRAARPRSWPPTRAPPAPSTGSRSTARCGVEGAGAARSRGARRRRTSTRGRATAGSPPGRRRSHASSQTATSSSASSRRSRSASRASTIRRCRRTGVATCSRRTRSSSGRAGRTGCTTASATSATATAGVALRLAP